jgi:hypothetical protein
MSDLQKAFPPIETGDEVPAVCVAIAILGLVVVGMIVAARMQLLEAQEAQVVITANAPVLPAP